MATAVRRAIRPISVAGPTAVTRTRPCPRVIAVPANTIADRSASGVASGNRRGALLDRDRFAGQRGFVCRNAFSGHKPSVSGDAPSFANDEEISLDDLLSRDNPLDTGSNHGSLKWH